MGEKGTKHFEEARVYLHLSGKQMDGSREEGAIHAIVSSFLDWESYPVVHGHRTFDISRVPSKVRRGNYARLRRQIPANTLTYILRELTTST